MDYAGDIMRGRLALALVSARAQKCPNRRCARKRHCLAAFRHDSNFHTRLGNCPIMSEIEWRAVSLGMQRVGTKIQRRPRAHAGPPDPSSQKLSAEEQHRRFWSAEAVKERADAEERTKRFRWPYASFLWTETEGERLAEPKNIAAAERALVAFMLGQGWSCAKAGRVTEECLEGKGRC